MTPSGSRATVGAPARPVKVGRDDAVGIGRAAPAARGEPPLNVGCTSPSLRAAAARPATAALPPAPAAAATRPALLVAVLLEADQRPAERLELDPAVALPVDADAQALLQLGRLRGAHADVDQPVERRRPPVDVDVEVFLEGFGDILPLQRINLVAPPRIRLGRSAGSAAPAPRSADRAGGAATTGATRTGEHADAARNDGKRQPSPGGEPHARHAPIKAAPRP